MPSTVHTPASHATEARRTPGRPLPSLSSSPEILPVPSRWPPRGEFKDAGFSSMHLLPALPCARHSLQALTGSQWSHPHYQRTALLSPRWLGLRTVALAPLCPCLNLPHLLPSPHPTQGYPCCLPVQGSWRPGVGLLETRTPGRADMAGSLPLRCQVGHLPGRGGRGGFRELLQACEAGPWGVTAVAQFLRLGFRKVLRFNDRQGNCWKYTNFLVKFSSF